MNKVKTQIPTSNQPLDADEQTTDIPSREHCRIAAYCRVSTDEEELARSLENQVTYFMETILQRSGWHLTGIYIDRGISGTTVHARPGLKRLLKHCELGHIDLILTKSISRLSRNTREFLDMLYRLRRLGVDILFEKENIQLSRTTDDFLLTLYGSVAEQEIVSNAQNIEWGYARRFSGGIPKFDPILGYAVDRSARQPVISVIPAEARVVREIFTMALKGTSLMEMTRHLIRRNIPKKDGTVNWQPGNIRYILTNGRYLGDTPARSYIDTKRNYSVQPGGGSRIKYLIPETHPAIIDRETFESVQRLLDKPKRNPKARTRYSLSGRVRCGHCSGPVHLRYQHKGVRGWRCTHSTSSLDLCPSRQIREADILQVVRTALGLHYGVLGSALKARLLQELVLLEQQYSTEEKRLDFIKRISAARQFGASDREELSSLERKYCQFERTSAMIEEDEVYRTKARGLLEPLNSEQCAPDQFTLETLRAWVVSVTLFSTDAAIVHWWDGTTTAIGNCSPHPPKPPPGNNTSSQKRDRRASGNAPSSLDATQAGDHQTAEPLDKRRGQPVIRTIKEKHGMSSVHYAYPQMRSVQLLSPAPDEHRGPLKVCAYCRGSTEADRQVASMVNQAAYFISLIHLTPGWDFAGIYMDMGCSGLRTTNRPEFQRMIRDCREGLVDRIITKSVSRFSRNTVDCLATVRSLADLNPPVGVFFEKENIHSLDPHGEFTLALHGSLAQDEAVSAGENVKWSRRKLLESGIYRHGGKPCYGYRVDSDGHWLIHLEEADTVRWIFASYANGQSFQYIADQLARQRIKSPRGKNNWSVTTVSELLKRETYIGKLVYQKSFVADPTSRRILPNTGQLPMYHIEDHHPPIIDKALWTAVQERIRIRTRRQKRLPTYPEGNGSTGRSGSTRKSFYGTFICGSCGRSVTHISGKRTHSGQIHYWRCGLASRRNTPSGDCDAGSFREEAICQALYLGLTHLYMNPSWPESTQLHMDSMQPTAEERRKVSNLQQELNKNCSRVTNLYQAGSLHSSEAPEVTQPLLEFIESILTLQKELSILLEKHRQADALPDLLKDFQQTLKVYVNCETEGQKKELEEKIMATYIKQGILNPENIIEFRFIFGVSVTVDLQSERASINN